VGDGLFFATDFGKSSNMAPFYKWFSIPYLLRKKNIASRIFCKATSRTNIEATNIPDMQTPAAT
jgi:hypothetical protein